MDFGEVNLFKAHSGTGYPMTVETAFKGFPGGSKTVIPPGDPSFILQEQIRSRQQAAKRERCRRDAKFLKKWIEDRNSRDPIARDVWWEIYHRLKKNCWWTFRNFEHWVRDLDYKNERKPVGDFTGKGILASGIVYLTDIPGDIHRPHRGRGGDSSEGPGLRSEAAPGHYREIGERSLGGDSIPGEIKELEDFGYVNYGYGKWTRLLLKEGKYGKFLSLESGDTVASKNEEGETITDTRTKSWFNLPYEEVIVNQVREMLDKAAEAMSALPK